MSILNHLEDVQREKGIRILMAVESGSRAWNIHSPDSDYDIRFIYRHLDVRRYLSLTPPADTVQQVVRNGTEVYDLVGWDIRKALRLAADSNPALLSWLHSPIFYVWDAAFGRSLRRALDGNISYARLLHHFYGLLRNTHRAYLQRPNPTLKKYFYALQPALSIQWFKNGWRGYPPVNFAQLLQEVNGPGNALPASLSEEIALLLNLKTGALEVATAPSHLPAVTAFIEAHLEKDRPLITAVGDKRPSTARLNRLFLRTLGY